MFRVALILFVECTLFIHLSAQDHTRNTVVYGEDISKEELLGQINPDSHSSFSLVPQKYASKSGIYLRTEVLLSFKDLHDAAIDEGLEIKILSGTRSFSYQQSIWERKWEKPRYMGWDDLDKALDILTYSSMPGTSRHHWGTDIDLNAFENEYFESGEGLEVYEFLNRCASTFGFQQVYTSKETTQSPRSGYEEEKWHWSYMPSSIPILNAYNELISTEDIQGFQGASQAESVKIIQNYVNGISILDLE
jgi:LAS superfamily LD-carboxypeptidase LdcB